MSTNETKNREEAFYNQLTLSPVTILHYKVSIDSRFLKDILSSQYGVASLFEITDLPVLWRLYSDINLHPKNVDNHRSYSAAIMKYIRFLNGGKRYGKKRSSKRTMRGKVGKKVSIKPKIEQSK